MRKLALILFLAAACAARAAEPALKIADADGVERAPLELKDKKAVVLFFVLHDCPIANSYAPEIKRICDEYESKGFAFYLVQSDPGLSREDAKKHAAEYGHRSPVLLDGQHALMKLAGATMTPEAAVLDAAGKRLYRGRIDDMYPELGKKRDRPTRRDLRAALDEIAAGKPVAVPETQAVGCFIPGLENAKK